MSIRSEQAFLDLIDRAFPTGVGHAGLPAGFGRGDDACIIEPEGALCLSSDLFLEDVHFRRSYFRPADIGHKALAVNLSDMAAMGARPRGFLMNLMVPPDLDEQYFRPLLAGMAELAEAFECPLLGGDLSRAASLGLAITIWGSAAPGGRFLTRGHARPGDELFVVGRLGLARVGLLTLERRGEAAKAALPEATAAHLRPRPLVAEGLALAGLPGVRGLMDVSDGLARDLPRFLALSPGHGADLALPAETLHPELREAAESPGEALRTAVLGGEDYALLGAAAPGALRCIQASVPGVLGIGAVTETAGLRVNGAAWTQEGFDHFGD
ncbi:MAG: thiamine-phosphate kinase [Desulfovibrionaceae bacterium]